MEQLTDREHFDEIISDPTEQVKTRIINFCDKWSDELNEFHPNVINFLTNLSGTKPSTVKGLVKCHKPPRPDGKHDIRLLLASCGTPSNPASKLFQYTISHIFPHLKSKMKDTKAILAKIISINEQYSDGLPDSAVHVGCDVKKLYPSVDKNMGLAAVRKWLVLFPNPEGLPTELIMELAQICVEENTCEFLGHFYCPNCGTATGPPHACDFADIFMGELDEKVEIELENRGIEHTGWTIYRDDGWMVALDGMEDVPVIEDILQNLHPNIDWEINPRGPSVQPFVNNDGSVVDRNTLEHLDLTIHFVEGKLETDIFAKDVPIYVSSKSCHPPQVFKSVAKSVGLRLRMNCSLDRY